MSLLNQCLNCMHQLNGPYCQNCGQKATTHRFSLEHFIEHEFIHGVWHLDKGLLYTLRHLLTRPGWFITGYLGGKRAGHFNVLTLLLLAIGLFLYTVPPVGMKEIADEGGVEAIRDAHKRDAILTAIAWVTHNIKWLILSLVPVLSFSSFIVFRRRKYFYTEHLVMNSYFFAGFIIFLTVANAALQLIYSREYVVGTSLDVMFAFVFIIISYWQTWKDNYSIAGWAWRFAAFTGLIVLFLAILTFIAVMSYAVYFLKLK